MTIDAALFYVYAAVALAGAVGLVTARRLVHAVVSLLATFVALAAIFLLMGSEFLAAMQLFVYGGAVTVLALFVLMLAKPSPEAVANPSPVGWSAAALATGVLFAALIWTLGSGGLKTHALARTTTAGLAEVLFTRYIVPFEIAGLLLTIALIGAVVLARSTHEEGPA